MGIAKRALEDRDVCVCVCEWGGVEEIKGRRRGSVREWVEGKDRQAEERESEKKREFLSLYPCLDFLAGPLKRAEIKKLTLAHQREI